MMKTMYIDMDNVICDFQKKYDSEYNHDNKWPNGRVGFYVELDPLEGAIDSINYLSENFRIYILTAPSEKNLNCYTEKAQWIKKYFGEKMLCKLIITPDKSLLRGDYLIDDNHQGKGQEGFHGKLIHFGSKDFADWNSIVTWLERQ